MSATAPARTSEGRGRWPVRVCFVCTGNICRSPMAEVVLASLSAGGSPAVEASSAGTGPWHVGEAMDPRAERALSKKGYAHHDHVARQFELRWFDEVDLVVCLGRRHLETLRGLARGNGATARLALLRPFDPASGGAVDIADPYYGDDEEFDACLEVVEASCRGLWRALRDDPTLSAGRR
jgi:protein-tyrosine phosphatase